jgi:hypothetical protein
MTTPDPDPDPAYAASSAAPAASDALAAAAAANGESPASPDNPNGEGAGNVSAGFALTPGVPRIVANGDALAGLAAAAAAPPNIPPDAAPPNAAAPASSTVPGTGGVPCEPGVGAGGIPITVLGPDDPVFANGKGGGDRCAPVAERARGGGSPGRVSCADSPDGTGAVWSTAPVDASDEPDASPPVATGIDALRDTAGTGPLAVADNAVDVAAGIDALRDAAGTEPLAADLIPALFESPVVDDVGTLGALDAEVAPDLIPALFESAPAVDTV